MKAYLVMYRWNDYDGSDHEIAIFSNSTAAEKHVEELEAEDFEQSREGWARYGSIASKLSPYWTTLEEFHKRTTSHSYEIVEMELGD